MEKQMDWFLLKQIKKIYKNSNANIIKMDKRINKN